MLKGVSFDARARHDDGAGRIERLGQEHADQPGDGVQPAAARPHPGRRARPGDDSAARLPRAAGVGAAGELPVRRHDRREHRLRQSERVARRDQGGRAHRALRGVHPALPGGLRHDRRRARHQAVRRPAPARVDRPRDSRQPEGADPRRSDVEPRLRERGDDSGRPARAARRAARRSSSRTGCRRFAAPIRFWCWKAARSSSAARTPSCSTKDGRYRQLYDKQYKIETNRFINPGEDFTPEPPKVVVASRGSNQL